MPGEQQCDQDPTWIVVLDGYDPMLERVRETLLTIADGHFGAQGSPLLHRGRARVLAAGLYDGCGPETHLLQCPLYSTVEADIEGEFAIRRTLDMRSATVEERVVAGGQRSVALDFASLPRPGVFAMRICGPCAYATDTVPSEMSAATADDGGVIAAIGQRSVEAAAGVTMDRIATYVTTSASPSDERPAVEGLEEAEREGFERLLVEHRAAWAARWEEADLVIEGDPALQRDVRFALYHLMGSVADSGEAAVGARGLSGPAYRGHVFWDADVYVLPFLAATHPQAARAMLEYRLRRLEPARARARAQGRRGARFPWESARDGMEVAPTRSRDRTGKVIPILTGELEEHIVADVAWAAACYVDWSGDDAFRTGGGAQLVVETARYWASRVRFDAAGRAHIDGVIGPDEYHERVDDNAFTNVMARWNLRRAAALASDVSEVTRDEVARWLHIADALVDGYDPATRIYEEFAGFRHLEPLVVARSVCTRPVAGDVLLGHDRVQHAQVIKQADVLMLHHLIPEEVAEGSLLPNLLYYEPRTAHGSSLSPGIHASLFARAWRLEDALRWLRVTTRIDLDDVGQSTAGGLHLAAMGSVWQALAFGFAGVRPRGAALHIDPRLPDAWRALELRLRFRGSRVALRIEPEQTVVRASPPVRVVPAAGRAEVADERGARFAIRSRNEAGTP